MDAHAPAGFANPTPTLSPVVDVCDGIPRSKWNFKLVTLRNDAGLFVTSQKVSAKMSIQLLLWTVTGRLLAMTELPFKLQSHYARMKSRLDGCGQLCH